MKKKIASGRFHRIIEKLTAVAVRRGFTIYAVGGFVRDLYLTREPKDLDIMVEGENGGILFARAAAADLGIREPVVFPLFGTARLFIDGEEIEFVMPRTESYAEHSRKPDTAHGSIEEDARRRDFTVNALFLRLNDMKVMDLTGYGIKDIKRRVIRVTDPPCADVIFSEDPLRMLRAVRQSVQLGFRIEPVTLRSLRRSVPRLRILSAERVRDELNKMLLCVRPSRPFLMMDSLGILPLIMPELTGMKGVPFVDCKSKDLFNHTLAFIDAVEPELALRYTALLQGIKDEAVVRLVLKRLRLSGEMIDTVLFLVRNYKRPLACDPSWTDAEVRRFVRDNGDHLEQILTLTQAYIRTSIPSKRPPLSRRLKKLRARVVETQKGRPVHSLDGVLDGHEIQKIFSLPPGPLIKEVKEFLIGRQLEDPLITRERAVKSARAFLKKQRSVK